MDDAQVRRSSTRRSRHLNRPERFQPVEPILRKKDSTSWDAWVLFSYIVTFWAPGPLLSSVGGLHDKASQQAWREKIALCSIAVILSGLVCFMTVGFTPVTCPASKAKNDEYLRYGENSGVVGILGWQFNVARSKVDKVDFNSLASQANGQDVTGYFTRHLNLIQTCQAPALQRFAAVRQNFCANTSAIQQPCIAGDLTPNTLTGLNLLNTTKKVGYDWNQLASRNLRNYMVINDKVLNMDLYMENNPIDKTDAVDTAIRSVLFNSHSEGGKDATRLFFSRNDLKNAIPCLTLKYIAGYIDKETAGCFVSQLVLYVALTVVLGVVMSRFIMAIVFTWFISDYLVKEPKPVKSLQELPSETEQGRDTTRWNELGIVTEDITIDNIGNDLYTILLVTCYSEGEEGLRITCESMASTTYPDDRKLLFFICDGVITGSGNNYSTPDICVRFMRLLPEFVDPEPKSYIAVGDGNKRHNRAKIYAGHYQYENRFIPMITVVKCGNLQEQGSLKPGNRGKRDSQVMLMHFFSRVTYNDRMTEFDYDLFTKCHHLMGVTPDVFEVVLMVDADTKVYPNSLRLLVNCMCNDPLIMGLCGETKIANKRDSWITAIQVFEYYINHHLSKSFESVFGGVTCLPGCFCMYRLKVRKGNDDWVPVIVKPEIVIEYARDKVETLHQKNLLLLGEDRFLTTLMLRHFPYRKMMFCPQAICKTIVPDELKILLSQRRRWINATIHNLMELVLVRNLCGTFCFSMQFVAFMELIGACVLPVAIVLTYSLIINMFIHPPKNFSDTIPLIMLVAVLGLPAVLVLITRGKIVYISWMALYLLALPVWNFVLPIYAYWHFDDFSWGETRKVEGEEGEGDDADNHEGEFDTSKIPMKRWQDWEKAKLRRIRRRDAQRTRNMQNAQGSGAGYYPPPYDGYHT
ncbi:687_t:CDS:2 [Paraglomus occultum]|uniref:chitin synthase n=1 Tax=Paraglomus occultum TaxID=144539 RepID=A0A9N8WEL2_9GLOM|nr:687_t:CDS:2 [Paraglomus occultum]